MGGTEDARRRRALGDEAGRAQGPQVVGREALWGGRRHRPVLVYGTERGEAETEDRNHRAALQLEHEAMMPRMAWRMLVLAALVFASGVTLRVAWKVLDEPAPAVG